MAEACFEHCRVERDGAGLDWLILDVDGAATNAISLELIESLHAALDRLDQRRDRRGLVLASAKTAGFAVGLSAPTLERLDDPAWVRNLVERGQALTRRLAEWPVPTVAIVHGVCQGGGLELALATRYRVAEASNTRLGFPEINLGLHPYFGATARLSALVGLSGALDLLLSGRMLGVDEAHRRGVIDRAGTTEGVETEAQGLVAERPGRQRPGPAQRVLSSWPVRWTMELIRRSDYREFVDPASHPGRTALYELWWRHSGRSPVRRIAAERDSFLELVQQRGVRNMVRVFLLQERFTRVAHREAGAKPQRVHIVGCGLLGAQLGVVLAARGIVVSFQDRTAGAEQAAVERARAAAHRSAAVVDDSLADRIVGTRGGADDGPIGAAEFVIEAVDEDLATKRTVLAEVAERVGADVPLATTTSLLTVGEIAEAVPAPERVLGLHFQISINSLTLATIVEVVCARETATAAAATGQALTLAMEHLPLVVADSPGFLINRLLLPYILAGAGRYTRPQREVIDAAARYVGMRVGPLELADWIGLDRCGRLARRLAGDANAPLPQPLQAHIDQGRLGRISGRGFHDWRGYKRVTTSIPPRHEPLDVLGPQLVEPAVEEAERCHREGVAADAEAIELAAVVGAGFPAHTGGPLRYQREVLGAGGSARRQRPRSLQERLRVLAGGAGR